MDTPVSPDITGTKKIIVLSIVGVVLALALAGVAIPEARVYIGETAKMLLNTIPSFVK
jgi:hypothetical protein